ncbi:hypothetical protein [Nocardia sp. alder85J]|uniref:hypothetical protein n=1 Tax=Nocardia sp. alder85J TaxID=2862949 RepID=UPI001CD2B085|nr:hypothetical protein [Nocardia sp. alder85J]MCX4092701.1 hypothetical protein [Nocardia sp. alder85J]
MAFGAPGGLMPPPMPGGGMPPQFGGVGVVLNLPPQAAEAPPAPERVAENVPAQPDRAMLHRTEGTRTYPCSACGGQLMFDIDSQKLRCPSCGNYNEISVPREPVVARDLQEAMAELREAQTAVAGPQVTGEREVKCQSCGGTTTFVGSLTATKCPYCATPIQRDDVHDAPARLPVDGVVPFRVNEKQARDLVERWVSKRWFAPSAFKKYRRLGSLASVYHAYFTYDADTYSWYTGERGIDYVVEYRDSDGDLQTETRTEWYPVSGEVANQFADMPALANIDLDHGKVKALEPWPIQEATGYSPEYLAGHLARTYDRDAEETFPEVRGEMEGLIEQSVNADIGGDRQRIHSLQSTWNALAYKHLLLPIWLLTVMYANQPFRVYINGLTGQVSGQRPWSKVKIAVAIVVVVLVAVIALVVYSKIHAHSGHHVSHPVRPTTRR